MSIRIPMRNWNRKAKIQTSIDSIVSEYLWGIEAAVWPLDQAEGSGVSEYLWGIETTNFWRTIFWSWGIRIPMRNWNLNFDTLLQTNNWYQNTYEELKHGGNNISTWWSTWYQNTYEELKQINCKINNPSVYVSEYLWGIETTYKII